MKVKFFFWAVVMVWGVRGADGISSSDPKDHERVKALEDELAAIQNSKKSILDYFKFWESDEDREADKQAELAAKQAELENAMREAGTLTEVNRSIGEGDNKINLSISLIAPSSEEESYELEVDPGFHIMRKYLNVVKTNTSPIAILEEMYNWLTGSEKPLNHREELYRRLLGAIEALLKFQNETKGAMLALQANIQHFLDGKFDLRTFYFKAKYLEFEEEIQLKGSSLMIDAATELDKQKEFFMKQFNELKSYHVIIDQELKSLYDLHADFLAIIDSRLKHMDSAEFEYEDHRQSFKELFAHRRKLINLINFFEADLDELGEMKQFLEEIYSAVETEKASNDFKLGQMSKKADGMLNTSQGNTSGGGDGNGDDDNDDMDLTQEADDGSDVINAAGANDEEYFKRREEQDQRISVRNDITDNINEGTSTMEEVTDTSITSEILDSGRLNAQNETVNKAKRSRKIL